MPFIVDASVVAAWLLPDEASPVTDLLLKRAVADRPRAPDILAHEIRSVAVRAVRRSRINESEAERLITRFEQIAVINAGPSNSIAAARLALLYGLSAYDAAYLWLAKTEGLELATLDAALRKAATAEGVALLPSAADNA